MMYIFGYGSLINIKSAQKTFKRILQQEDFIPVVLDGYKKVWNSIESIVFEGEETPVNGVFLNLQKDVSSNTPGVLLKITDNEYEFLKQREKNYSCIELDSKAFSGFSTDDKIFTFTTTNSEKIAKEGDENTFIPKKYISLLEEGAENYNFEFYESFKNSYTDFLFPIKDGVYKFSDPIQNKFAKDGIIDES